MYRLRELATKPNATAREAELASALQDALDDLAVLRARLESVSDDLSDIMNAAKEAQRGLA